jgi:hypothetical protein
MYTDADNISGHDALRRNLFQRFIDENGVASDLRRRCSKNEQPTRCDDGGTEGVVTGIYEMDTHRI